MSRTARSSVIVSLALVLAGCGSARMELPQALEGAERLAVEGRGGLKQARDIRFGPYEAVGIQRSWTKGSGWSVGAGRLGGGSDRAKQTYAFTLAESGREHGRVECEARGSRGRLGVRSVDIDLASDEGLHCTLGLVEGAVAWELTLHSNRDRHLEGELVAGEDRYRLVGSGSGGRMTPANTYGYELRSGDRVLAAVETVSKGAVWLAPDVNEAARPALAAAAASLLLYQKVKTD
jgi:hypothetical protein